MNKSQRAEAVCKILNEEYGTDMKCYLEYDEDKPWQLLFATILSAQCTDDRVNMVTKDLFLKYPTLESFAEADIKELEKDIYSIGFYRNKAKNIIACANVLLDEYGGDLPSDMDALVSLPGVGRKTANVIRGHIFNEASIVVDTHVKRVWKLLGLTNNTDPTKVEYDLMKVLPKNQWILYNLQTIAHGRSICISGRPRCAECCLIDICKNKKEVR